MPTSRNTSNIQGLDTVSQARGWVRGAAHVIQMSALTRDRGNQSRVCGPEPQYPASTESGQEKVKRGKKHPSNTHFPAPNTWSSLPSHRTTAPPSSQHSWALSGQGNPERQPPAHRSHRCPGPQKRSGSQPSWKGLQRPSSTSPPFPQGGDKPREGA